MVPLKMSGLHVVVTGGAGFIGANLCRALVAAPSIASVRVLDDFSTGHRDNLVGVDDVRLVEGSILDETALDEVCAGATSIVHLAALGSVPRSIENPMATHAVNSTGTLMVLEAARRHGHLHTIVAGSSSVYGSNPVLPKHEELTTRPMSPYGASKLLTEGAALAWQASYGLPVLAFRFFNVFGPFQRAGHPYAAVIPRFIDAALRGEPLEVHGDGTQSRDFTFVDSVTTTIVDALVRRVTHDGPVNLAFGTRVTLNEVIAELERLLGRPLQRRQVAPRPGDVPHSQASTDTLRSLFPASISAALQGALRRTLDWLSSRREA